MCIENIGVMEIKIGLSYTFKVCCLRILNGEQTTKVKSKTHLIPLKQCDCKFSDE